MSPKGGIVVKVNLQAECQSVLLVDTYSFLLCFENVPSCELIRRSQPGTKGALAPG